MEHTDQAQKECAVAKFHNNHNNCNSSSKKSGSVVVIDSSVKAFLLTFGKSPGQNPLPNLGVILPKFMPDTFDVKS